MTISHSLKVPLLLAAISVTSLLLSGCQLGGQSATTQTPAPAAATNSTTPTAATAVAIEGMAFNPKTIQVKVGQTVSWTNNDQVPHTVTSDTGDFDSGNLANGGTYSFTFSKAGTFAYHCTVHPSMKAQVVVTE